MVSNRNHAETLVHCLDQYIGAQFAVRNGETMAVLTQTRGFLVLAIEMALNELVEE